MDSGQAIGTYSITNLLNLDVNNHNLFKSKFLDEAHEYNANLLYIESVLNDNGTQIDNCLELIDGIDVIRIRIYEQLVLSLQRCQALKEIGFSFDMETMYTALEKLFYKIMMLIDRMYNNATNNLHARKRLTCIHQNTIESAFIVATQPKQIIQKNVSQMQLKEMTRKRENGAAVTDEKYFFHFELSFQLYGESKTASVMSLPVVLTTHGSQDSQSTATIIWHNAFNGSSDAVKWSDMATLLETKFLDETKGKLTPENLHCLREKALGQSIQTNFTTDTKLTITRNQFSRDRLPGREFTFWGWFNAIMKLITKAKLIDLWNAGLIIGFINKQQAEEQLLRTRPGTFLLRFSDSLLGGIGITLVEHIEQKPHITNILPFVNKDLSIRKLADRIHDLSQCKTLYPDITKDQAFGDYYDTTPIAQPDNTGYVRPGLVTVLPNTTSVIPSAHQIDNNQVSNQVTSTTQDQVEHLNSNCSNEQDRMEWDENTWHFDLGLLNPQ